MASRKLPGIQIDMKGLAETVEIFKALPKEAERARINGINRTATEVRREEIVLPMSRDTGIKRKILNDRIRIERAQRGKETARIVPSSAGIPVPEYRYRMQPTAHPTRARILVDWPGGKKVAAGFINPLGKRQAPLRSYNHKGKLSPPETALAPSAAALFKVVVTDEVRGRAADRLQINVDRALMDQIKKRK